MQARKVAYIAALIMVELLAPNDAHAGGTGEYIPPVEQRQSQMVTISQEEYRQLIEAQVRLQLFEGGQTEYAMTITGSNDKLEEAYKENDRLKQEISLLKGIPPKNPTVKERLSFGGGVAIDVEQNIGGFGLVDFKVTDQIDAIGEVIYTDRFVGTFGFRVSPW
jgi:hypothetical protein